MQTQTLKAAKAARNVRADIRTALNLACLRTPQKTSANAIAEVAYPLAFGKPYDGSEVARRNRYLVIKEIQYLTRL